MQHQRQEQFRSVKLQRDDDQKRELKLGYLQNHVRGQEMDFQRLHRIMGVKFTPEKPDSVQEIVKASLSHEQRNASLLHYVGVQNMQIEEIEEHVRALEKEEAALKVETKKSEEQSVVSVAEAGCYRFAARVKTSAATSEMSKWSAPCWVRALGGPTVPTWKP